MQDTAAARKTKLINYYYTFKYYYLLILRMTQ